MSVQFALAIQFLHAILPVGPNILDVAHGCAAQRLVANVDETNDVGGVFRIDRRDFFFDILLQLQQRKQEGRVVKNRTERSVSAEQIQIFKLKKSKM